MNYYEPRQVDPEADRPDAGKWRYTVMNNSAVWAIGNCMAPCPGHETPEEAIAHQRAYDLEHAKFGGKSEPWSPCEVCEKRTAQHARIGPGMGAIIPLCTEHLNVEALDTVYNGPGHIMSSC